MGVKGLFDVVHQRRAALFRQAHRHQPSLGQHTAAAEPAGTQQGEHLPGQLQLLHRQRAGLVELRLVIRPEGGQPGILRVGEGDKLRIGVIPAELVDVVALAAVPPSGEAGQLLRVVEVILPHPLVGDAEAGVAQTQTGELVLRHNGQAEGQLFGGAVALDGRQGRVHIALRPGDGVVEHGVAVDVIADDQAARRLGKGRVQMAAPHELHAQGVFAQAVVTVFVIGAQMRAVFGSQFLELQHTNLTFFLSYPGTG